MMTDKRDYYEVLEVSKDAEQDEIKKAYRRLARKHHPDVNHGDDGAEERFKELNEAYEVLSDPQKRDIYDRFGHSGVNGGGAQGPGGYGAGGFNVDFGGFGDIFDMFFGGGAGGGARQTRADRTGPQRGSDLRYDIELTLEEAAVGVDKTIKFSRLEVCETCHGSGAKAGSQPETCNTCHGSGQVRQQQQTFLGTSVRIVTCPNCGGEGRIITDPCPDCSGRGRVKRAVEKEIHIPAGVDDETRIRLSGEGETGLRGGPAGDLYVVTFIRQHEFFERRGHDIWCEIPISFAQAALGAVIKIKTLTGEESLNIDAGTQTGEVYTLRGKGMPDPHGRGTGSLNVIVKIKTPTKLSDEQKELLKNFAESRGEKLEIPEEKGFFDKVKDAFTGK